MILGVDTETTGLHVPSLKLLEVALLVANDDLQPVAVKSWFVPCDTIEAFNSSDAYVQNMHKTNGLWEAHHQAMSSGLTDPTNEIRGWCAEHGIYPENQAMFGQGVGYDRDVLATHLPGVRQMWNHRTFDVSGLRDFVRDWYKLPKHWPNPNEQKQTAHRAQDDILWSLSVLRTIRDNFMKPFGTTQPNFAPVEGPTGG